MTSLPTSGQSWTSLQTKLSEMRRNDAAWDRGRTALFVFNAGDDVRRVGEDAYRMFMAENALGARAFPSVTELETGVVDIALSLLNAPPGASGNMTSGGSESILMAVKACRDWARANDGPRNGQILLPATAHPAFEKAAHTLGLTTHRIAVGDNFRADPSAMADAINADTIMLVGSAPCFPYGVIDPISELAGVAKSHGLWMHVDACVGGYFLPFAEENGCPIPAFDFRIDGVCSLSADLHKYGYTPKGASTVLYRESARHAFQYYEFDVWVNGPMRTATVAGTRPGGAIAAAWAVLNYLGRDGYREKARMVMDARAALEHGLANLDFEIYGAPDKGLIAFGHRHRDSHAIADDMASCGWVSSRVAAPDGIHLMLSPAHVNFTADYLSDLTAAVDAAPAKQTGRKSRGVYA